MSIFKKQILLGLMTFALTVGNTYAADGASAPKPKFGSTAKRLFLSHDYLQHNPAPDYWALSPYYVPQMNPAACSLASMAMLVNAARAKSNLTASDELVSQSGLLEKVNSPVWNEGVAKSKGGVDLDQLGVLVEQSLKAYGMNNVKVETIHVDSASPEMKKKLLSYLAKNEKNPNDFILANFLQSEYTGDPEGAVGHISPVGAYDAKNKQVLVMDIDRQYYEPYWVSEDTFLKGLATKDSGGKAFRGFVYVSIQK